MNIGIAIDEWKQPVFRKHLEGAGFQFSAGVGVARGTLLLKVEARQDEVPRLAGVIESAQRECATLSMAENQAGRRTH